LAIADGRDEWSAMNSDNSFSDSDAAPASPTEVPRRRRAAWPLVVVAALLVIVPFWTWYGTWFGRQLSDEQLTQYFSGSEKPRKLQHALLQLEQRIVAGDQSVKPWYPRIVELKDHAVPEIRVTAAWVMGQDNTSESFHHALLDLLRDPHPLVRRNAALGLVRFRDDRGHPELLAMLRPYTIQAPSEGAATIHLKAGQPVTPEALVARIRRSGNEVLDIRSPLPGYVNEVMVETGARVREGKELIVLDPDKGQVWEALRALYLVGQAADLPEIERYARGAYEMPERIQQQAVLTAAAIRKRQQAATQPSPSAMR
jgi:hypothetical protein